MPVPEKRGELTIMSKTRLESILTTAIRLKYAPVAIATVVFLSCTSAPRYRGEPALVSPGNSAKRKEVVAIARSFIGVPYRSGGTSRSGVDCSGLVFAVYGSVGIGLPRTSIAQSHVGKLVAPGSLSPGDLVFFATGRGRRVSHVGIYIGGGKFIHASTRAGRVRTDSMDHEYFKRRFVTARRVLH